MEGQPLKSGDAAAGVTSQALQGHKVSILDGDDGPDAAAGPKLTTLESWNCEVAGEKPHAPLFAYSYFAGVFILSSANTLMAISLWSSMGCGDACIRVFVNNPQYRYIFYGLLGCTLLGLYILDFVSPPHIDGKMFLFCENDYWRKPFALASLVTGFLGVCLFSASVYYSAPLLVSIYMLPLLIACFRQACLPPDPEMPTLDKCDFALRTQYLEQLLDKEADQMSFYSQASLALVASGGVAGIAWLAWWFTAPAEEKSMTDWEENKEAEARFIRWSAPFVVAASYLAFSGLLLLRVWLSKSYARTDQARNEAMVRVASASNKKGTTEQERVLNMRITRMESKIEEDKKSGVLRMDTETKQRYLDQHEAFMSRMTGFVKVAASGGVVLMAVIYVTVQMVASDSHIAFMAQGYMMCFFLTCGSFIYFSFHRLFDALKVWLVDMPLVKSALDAAKSDWAIAMFLCIFLPLAPVFFAMSAIKQKVRRLRGICDEDTWFTKRTMKFLKENVANWNKISLVSKTYIMGVGFILYTLTPRCLNISLSWMGYFMAEFHIALVMLGTFVFGLILFLLPPVPGAPVYFFGGVIITKQWPVAHGGEAMGAFMCVVLCMILKLAACAVQQQIIGRSLGSNETIQQVCGCHKPFIRAIERVLRRDGLSIGKCVILCGGPDWPVSVLAGILKLSLLQCELGTLPIIFYVTPLSLTGSFYVLQDQGDFYVKMSALMFFLTGFITIVLWAGIGWSIQTEFDKYFEELNRPMEKYIQLDWLDFRSSQLEESASVQWEEVPGCLRIVFVGGAALELVVAQFLFLLPTIFFNDFGVTDDWQTLKWLGDDGIVMPLGALALGVSAFAVFGHVVYNIWKKKATAERVHKCNEMKREKQPWRPSGQQH
eukprot:TRINITY_DN9049_c0_g1_i4.p1 TRINITY_DN9049_c0_g1~~TRINITY_DN9049_c0_g1_i4.p1  ORF type:complete len:886 (-),score=184.90 TRINITY_DN9049_c0_g1_i4:555-3212(-)